MNQRCHGNASAHVLVSKQREIANPHWTCGENAHAHTVHEKPEAVHGYLPDRVRGCCLSQVPTHCAACAARP